MKEFDKDELIQAVFGFIALFLLFCFAGFLTFLEEQAY